jgi:hypothetical protein
MDFDELIGGSDRVGMSHHVQHRTRIHINRERRIYE